MAENRKNYKKLTSSDCLSVNVLLNNVTFTHSFRFRSQAKHENLNEDRLHTIAAKMYSPMTRFWKYKVRMFTVLQFFMKIFARPRYTWAMHVVLVICPKYWAILWHGPLQIRGQGAGCSKEQWWLRKHKFRVARFGMLLQGFLVFSWRHVHVVMSLCRQAWLSGSELTTWLLYVKPAVIRDR